MFFDQPLNEQPDLWLAFHRKVAGAMLGKQKPSSIYGLGLGGQFAAQYITAKSDGVAMAPSPGPGVLTIGLTDSEELRAISTLGYPVAWIYDVLPSELPWETDETPKAPGGLARILRELADYIDLTSNK